MFQPHTFQPRLYGVPTIRILQSALDDMHHLVQLVDMEVGWLVVVHEQDDGDFLLSEVVLPGQDCHSTTTELSADGLAQICMELMDEDAKAGVKSSDPRFRANHLNCWVHSHANMDVGPSGQDDQQMEEFCRMYEGDHDTWIRGIMNKKGKAEFTVYYRCGKTWKPIRDVPWQVESQADPDRRKHWESLVSERVKHLSYAGGGKYSGAGAYNSGYAGAPRYGRYSTPVGSRQPPPQPPVGGRVITPEDRRWTGRVGKGPGGAR